MDLWQFIAALVEALAWPATVIILALLFRRSVLRLLPGLSKLKWKDLELEFKKELESLTAAAQQAQLPSSASETTVEEPAESRRLPPPKNLQAEIEAVAEVSPNAAIPLAWAAVESALTSAVMRLAVSPDYPPHNSATQNIAFLKAAGLLDDQSIHFLNQFRQLRNRIVHGDLEHLAVSRADALRYSELAQKTIAKLEELRR